MLSLFFSKLLLCHGGIKTLFCECNQRRLIIVLCGALTILWTSYISAENSEKIISSSETQTLKAKVAQATRMLVREGLLASSGHVSARIPGTNKVLIGPRDVSRAILQAEHIVTVDLDSNKVDGDRNPPRETEIHTGIYRARPDVMSVIHTHPIHSVIFSITGKPIVPVIVHGAIFGKGVPVHNHVGHINSRELGNELASVLGDSQAILMKMHGAVIVGPSIERAFAYSLYLEDNAEKQLLGEISGSVIAMTPEEVKRSLRVAFGDLSILKRWQFYREKEKKALRNVN